MSDDREGETRIAVRFTGDGPELSAEKAILGSLTDREREVLDLVIAPFSNKEIARRIGRSEVTVESRLRAIRKKLGTTSRNDTARAYRALIGDQGKTLEGFPGIPAFDWADLTPGQDAAASEPLVLRDGAAFGFDPPRQGRHEQPGVFQVLADGGGGTSRLALSLNLAIGFAVLLIAAYTIVRMFEEANVRSLVM